MLGIARYLISSELKKCLLTAQRGIIRQQIMNASPTVAELITDITKKQLCIGKLCVQLSNYSQVKLFLEVETNYRLYSRFGGDTTICVKT